MKRRPAGNFDLFSVLARDRVESAYLTYECVRVCGWCLKTPVFGLWIRSMCWGPRGVTQVRPTSRSTCVTDSRSNLISGPLSSPMVHVVWPLTYTHGPNTHTTHTRGHSDLTLGLSDLCSRGHSDLTLGLSDLCSAYLASHGLAGLAVPERTVKSPTVCNVQPVHRQPGRLGAQTTYSSSGAVGGKAVLTSLLVCLTTSLLVYPKLFRPVSAWPHTVPRDWLPTAWGRALRGRRGARRARGRRALRCLRRRGRPGLSPLRGRCRRRRCRRRRRFHGSSGPAVVSARDEAPCFGSVAGLHRVLQRGDIEALVGITLAPPASHSRSSASVGGRQQQPLGPPLLRVLR